MDWGQDLDKHVSEQSNEAGQGTEDSNYSEPSNQSNVQPAPTASLEDKLSQTSDNVSVKNRNNELQSADPGASESDRSQLTSPEILEFPLDLEDNGGPQQDDSATTGTAKVEPSSDENHGMSDLKSTPSVNPTYAQLIVEARKKSEELKAKGTGFFLFCFVFLFHTTF